MIEQVASLEFRTLEDLADDLAKVLPKHLQIPYDEQNLQLRMTKHVNFPRHQGQVFFVTRVQRHGRKIESCCGVVHQPPPSCWLRQCK